MCIRDRIESEGLTENAGYGDAVMDKLADALGVDRSTLVRCVQFVRAYPKGVPETDLNWSQIRLLLTVADPKDRAYYQEDVYKRQATSSLVSSTSFILANGCGVKIP